MIAGLTRQLSRKGFDGLAFWGSISYQMTPTQADSLISALEKCAANIAGIGISIMVFSIVYALTDRRK